ncbi:MAG: cytochrome P450 [Sphingomonas fennica]
MTPTAADRPPHVSAEQWVDFDFYRPCEPGGDPFLAWKRLQGGPAMRWTPHNGGHWIATRGEDIRAILSDWERFSSSSAFIPKMDRPRGVPLEYDPPAHTPLRKVLMPAFTPRAVKRWGEEARALAIDLIAAMQPRGACEFIGEFAQQLPIIIFLRMMDLPEADREPLLAAVNATLRPRDEAERAEARRYMNAYIAALVDDRMAAPRDDLLSDALQADIGGRTMNLEEARGLASGLLGGGLDTVASMMGWSALFLAENPGHRAQLIETPALIPKAIEELLRRFAIANIARVVRDRTDYEGAAMQPGEQVLMSACLHSMDETLFDDPLTVDFKRKDSWKHATFSYGVHRCIGAPLATAEIRIFLEEWLARIPDFTLDPADPPVRATGIVHGLTRLPLRW